MGRLSITLAVDKAKSIDRNRWSLHPDSALIDVAGELVICIGGETLFREDSVPLLEFGVALETWLRHVRSGVLGDFVYESVENEDPILQFFRQDDGTWVVHSIWQLFESKEVLSTDELLGEVEVFLSALKAELYDLYGIKLEDYTWQHE